MTAPAYAKEEAQGFAPYQRRKRELIAGLRGTVLEVGAGYGRNFSDLHPGVTWIGLEPDDKRRRALARTAGRRGRSAEPLAAPLEAIPMDDGSVSAVLSTVVLCSVRDQDTALREIARVLQPGGVLVFAEHVAAPPRTWKRGVQRAVAPVSKVLDSGCDPARDTATAIESSPLEVVEIGWFALPVLLGLTVPYIVGQAVKIR